MYSKIDNRSLFLNTNSFNNNPKAATGNNDNSAMNHKLNRLGSNALASHSMAGSIQDAMSTLSNEKLQQMLVNILGNSNSDNEQHDIKNKPRLKTVSELKPFSKKSNAKVSTAGSEVKGSDNTSAQIANGNKVNVNKDDQNSTADTENKKVDIYTLFSEISSILKESSIEKTKITINNYKALMQGVQNQYESLADQLIQISSDIVSNQEKIKELESADPLQSLAVAAISVTLKAEQAVLDALQEQAKTQIPVPPDLAVKIIAAQTLVGATQKALDIAIDSAKKQISDQLSELQQSLNQMQELAKATISQSIALTSNLNPVQYEQVTEIAKAKDKSKPSLAYLTALLSKLLDENSKDKLLSSAELHKKLSEGAQKDADKKAADFAEQQRKAEETSKVMGCLAKIAGWALTAFSFASAIFTGGASLALAAVGLAMAVADEVYQDLTGKSLMGEIMDPIMKYVVQPLMNEISKLVTGFLESLGVSKDIAEKIGKVVGMIATALVMIAGAYLANKVMGSVISKFASNAGKEALKEVEEEVIKNETKKFSEKLASNIFKKTFKNLKSGLGRSKMGWGKEDYAKFNNMTRNVQSAGNMLVSGIDAAKNITVGVFNLEAEKMKAELKNNAALQKIILGLLESQVEASKHEMSVIAAMLKNISSIQATDKSTNMFITDNFICHR